MRFSSFPVLSLQIPTPDEGRDKAVETSYFKKKSWDRVRLVSWEFEEMYITQPGSLET